MNISPYQKLAIFIVSIFASISHVSAQVGSTYTLDYPTLARAGVDRTIPAGIIKYSEVGSLDTSNYYRTIFSSGLDFEGFEVSELSFVVRDVIIYRYADNDRNGQFSHFPSLGKVDVSYVDENGVLQSTFDSLEDLGTIEVLDSKFTGPGASGPYVPNLSGDFKVTINLGRMKGIAFPGGLPINGGFKHPTFRLGEVSLKVSSMESKYETPYTGSVVKVRGKIIVTREGETIELKNGVGLNEGDIIDTPPRTFVKFRGSDGSMFTIGPESKFVVKKFDQKEKSLILLLKGKLRAFVDRRFSSRKKSSKKLIIRTRTASFGVRNTTFTFSAEENEGVEVVTCEVEEGVVDFQNYSTGQVVQVAGGQSHTFETALAGLPSIAVADGGAFGHELETRSLIPGKTFSVETDIINSGRNFSPEFSVGLFLSEDNIITDKDTLIGEKTLSPIEGGGVKVAELLGTVPLDLAHGDYYLGWIIYDGVGEGRSAIQTITYADGESLLSLGDAFVDLMIEDDVDVYTVSKVAPGASFPLSCEVLNNGSISSTEFKAKAYLSSDALIDGSDFLIGEASSAALASGKYGSLDFQGAVITDDLPLGDYHLIFELDSDGAASESDELNNLYVYSTSLIQVVESSVDLRDSGDLYHFVNRLEFEDPSNSDSVQRLSASVDVFNDGSSDSGEVKAFLYLSEDADITGSDIFVAEKMISNILPQSSASFDLPSFHLPSAVTLGNYYLGWRIVRSSDSEEFTILHLDGEEKVSLVEKLPPYITSLDSASVEVFQNFSYQIEADHDAVSYSLVNPPSGMTVDSSSGLIVWTPVAEGDFSVNIVASNTGGSDVLTLKIEVLANLVGVAIEQETGVHSQHPSWFLQAVQTLDGVDAAQAADISDDESSSFVLHRETDEELVSFWWKSDSEEDYDFLIFEVNGQEFARISGDTDWRREVHNIPSGSNEFLWTYRKDDSDSEGGDTGWVDSVSFGSFSQFPVIAGLGKVLEQPDLSFRKYHDTSWLEQPYPGSIGGSVAASGVIGHNESSSMSLVVEGNKSLSFDWAVSSEEDCDLLRVFLNGDLVQQISGEVDWTQVDISLPSGRNVLMWQYEKDNSGSEGEDRAWVDNVTISVILSPYDEWVNQFSSLPQAERSPDSTPAGDGVSNQFKFLLGLDPTLPLNQDPHAENYPRVVSDENGPGIQYKLGLEAHEFGQERLFFQPQFSSDLITWRAVSAVEDAEGFSRVVSPFNSQSEAFFRFRIGIEGLLLTHSELADEFVARMSRDLGIDLSLVKVDTLQAGHIVVEDLDLFDPELGPYYAAYYIGDYNPGESLANYIIDYNDDFSYPLDDNFDGTFSGFDGFGNNSSF